MDDLPFLPAIYASKLLEAMEDEQLPVDYILHRAHINRSVFSSAAGYLTINQTRLLLTEYTAITKVSFPAVRYGRRLSLVEHGILGFILSWRGGFRDMLMMLINYLFVRLPVLNINMVHGKDYFALRLSCHKDAKECEAFILQAFISSFYENGLKVTHNIVVHCRGDLFGDTGLLSAVMPVKLVSQQEFNEIRFYVSAESMPGHARRKTDIVVHADPFQEHAVVVRLRSLLLAQLGRNQSAEEVAAQMGMSERTLRRRLADGGMSFNRIRSDVRMTVAERYLKTSDMSIQRIAEMVGYSDQATFTRAFGEWSELTPLAVRRQHRRIASPATERKVPEV